MKSLKNARCSMIHIIFRGMYRDRYHTWLIILFPTIPDFTSYSTTGFSVDWNFWATPRENLSLGFATRQDTNWPAQLQRPARILKFRIYKLEVSFWLSREQQRCWSDCADAQADLPLYCLHLAYDTFSHGLAHWFHMDIHIDLGQQ